MGREDKRWAIGVLCAIAIILAAALLIGLHIEPQGSLAHWSQSLAPHVWRWLRSPGRKGWATIVQLVGAFVTLIGFWTAWLRARHGITITGLAKRLWAWIRKWLAKLLGRPRDAVVAPHGIPPASIVGGIAIVSVTFNIDPNQSTDENLGRLAQFVNNLSGNTIPQLEKHIETLREKVKEVHAHAAELSAQTLEHMQEQIDGLQRELDNKQVLDLRWAVYGLLITFFGIWLGYGT